LVSAITPIIGEEKGKVKVFVRASDISGELSRQMISIRKNVSELERCIQVRDLALDCYASAVRNAAHYAIEVDPALLAGHRQYLNALAGEITCGDPEILQESRSTVRGLLRDYRDKVAECLAKLRDELAGTARALQQTLESMAQSDDDHESRLRGALHILRSLAAESGESPQARERIVGATGAIEQSLEQLRKQHQVTVSQFLTEIRMLHKRIDALEAAASIDDLTKLFNRREMEERIRGLATGSYCLLLVRAGGLRNAAVQFCPAVAMELTAAFTKRLRNSVPDQATIGRGGEEDFVAILQSSKTEAMTRGKFVAEHLGGAYVCVQSGKAVRPVLQLRLAVVDSNGDKPEKVLSRVQEFLPDR
jgi:GGDEF domain-containing protein